MRVSLEKRLCLVPTNKPISVIFVVCQIIEEKKVIINFEELWLKKCGSGFTLMLALNGEMCCWSPTPLRLSNTNSESTNNSNGWRSDYNWDYSIENIIFNNPLE